MDLEGCDGTTLCECVVFFVIGLVDCRKLLVEQVYAICSFSQRKLLTLPFGCLVRKTLSDLFADLIIVVVIKLVSLLNQALRLNFNEFVAT